MDTKALVLDFIVKNAVKPVPQTGEAELLGCRYLDTGIIDSFGIVMMITEFEDSMGVSFSATDMQSYEFQTIGGLIGLINRKLAEKR